MKLRTNSRPAPLCSLQRLCPRVLKMNNLDGFAFLFGLQQSALVNPYDGVDYETASSLLNEFLTLRGLVFEPNGDRHRGCSVFALTRSGKLLATFSVEVASS